MDSSDKVERFSVVCGNVLWHLTKRNFQSWSQSFQDSPLFDQQNLCTTSLFVILTLLEFLLIVFPISGQYYLGSSIKSNSSISVLSWDTSNSSTHSVLLFTFTIKSGLLFIEWYMVFYLKWLNIWIYHLFMGHLKMLNQQTCGQSHHTSQPECWWPTAIEHQ